MIKKSKPRWSELTTHQLAAATREFDAPNHRLPAQTPTRRESAQLRRAQRHAAARRLRIALSLEKNIIEHTDAYAATHGITFSDVVSDALRRFLRKRSA